MTKQKISLTLLFIPYILLSQMILIDKMEVNELNSPIGLDDQNPNFSWKINCINLIVLIGFGRMY